MERLRIGVIGLGWFGEIHCDAIIGTPSLELASLCTRTPDRLEAMGKKFGVKKLVTDYKEMIADPDIDAVTGAVTCTGAFACPEFTICKLKKLITQYKK